MKFVLSQEHPRRGWLTLADGQRVRTPVVVPLFHQPTTSPLMARELRQLGTDLVATDLASAMTIPGEAAIKRAGGLGEWISWPGALISLAGFNAPLESVKKNRARVGVHYQKGQNEARQTVTAAEFADWQRTARAAIQLPLNQAPKHYAPVNDIERAVTVNLAWDQETATGWGVVEGGGLRRARQRSVDQLVAAGRTGFYLGGFGQPLPAAEWQRALEMTLGLLPPAAPRMVTVRELTNLPAALLAGVDIVVTDLPMVLADRGQLLTRELAVLDWRRFRKEAVGLAGLTPEALASLTAHRTPLATRLLVSHNLVALGDWVRGVREGNR